METGKWKLEMEREILGELLGFSLYTSDFRLLTLDS
jgi:hypothetical protein